MDIIEATGDFQDWELLHPNSVSHPIDSVNSLEDIDSEGIIHTDYFSLDSRNRHVPAVRHEDSDDNKSAESDNPSWIEPGAEENPVRYLNKDSGEFWTDSSSDRSGDHKVVEFEGKNEMGFLPNEKEQLGLAETQEIVEKKEELPDDLERFYSDSVGIKEDAVKFDPFEEKSAEENTKLRDGSADLCEEKPAGESIEGGNEIINESGNAKSGEIEKRTVVWWKMPIEFLKYFVFRVSPVWTFSVAAAVLGLVILGRRFRKVKKRTKGLELKVTVDDKKVSQFMSRAARLNEAFSVVKRVPVIRPSLPGAGVTPWPVMSLR